MRAALAAAIAQKIRTLASDAFTRADNAASLGTADVGGAWANAVGTFGIASNKAVGKGATENDALLNVGTQTDETVAVAVATLDSNAGGIWARADATAANGYLLVVATAGIDLYKRVGGSFTLLAHNAAVPNNGDVITVKCAGTALSVLRNGAAVSGMSVTDSAVASGGYVGFYRFGTTTETFDNFLATAP